MPDITNAFHTKRNVKWILASNTVWLRPALVNKPHWVLTNCLDDVTDDDAIDDVILEALDVPFALALVQVVIGPVGVDLEQARRRRVTSQSTKAGINATSRASVSYKNGDLCSHDNGTHRRNPDWLSP